MTIKTRLLPPIVTVLVLGMTGCDKNENARVAEMAERQLERQAEQNRQVSDLQHEVAEGARSLVEADAKARQDMLTLQREIQTERNELSRQRDLLEGDRRDMASKRHFDPIIAEALSSVGLLLACLLPLIVCWYLLQHRVEPADDQAIAEMLLEDLVADKPLLLAPPERFPALSSNNNSTNATQGPEEST